MYSRYARFARRNNKKKKKGTVKGHLLKGAAGGAGAGVLVTGLSGANHRYKMSREFDNSGKVASLKNAIKDGVKDGASVFRQPKHIAKTAAIGAGVGAAILGAKKFRDRRKKKRRRSLR